MPKLNLDAPAWTITEEITAEGCVFDPTVVAEANTNADHDRMTICGEAGRCLVLLSTSKDGAGNNITTKVGSCVDGRPAPAAIVS